METLARRGGRMVSGRKDQPFCLIVVKRMKGVVWR